MIHIDHLTLNLPAGDAAFGHQVAQRLAQILADPQLIAGMPSGEHRLEQLRINPVIVPPNADAGMVAQAAADQIMAALHSNGGRYG